MYIYVFKCLTQFKKNFPTNYIVHNSTAIVNKHLSCQFKSVACFAVTTRYLADASALTTPTGVALWNNYNDHSTHR